MTKEELFTKYNIDSSHDTWDNMIDNWQSVEIYRAMHSGMLPPPDGVVENKLYILEFLDKCRDGKYFFALPASSRGSMFLTAKRWVARHHEYLLKQVND